MISKTLKWLFYIITAMVLIAVLIGAYCHYQMHQRETATAKEIAPMNSFIKLDDATIFFQENGTSNKQAVLLIHGTGSWSEIWKETMQHLAANNLHSLAIDMPPFGFSDKPAGAQAYSTVKQAARINNFIEAMKLDSVILVAHSVGARAAVQSVLEKRSRVTKLILVDPALSFSDDSTKIEFQQNDPAFVAELLFASQWIRNAGIAAFGTNPSRTRSAFESFVFNKQSITDDKVDMINRPLTIQGITNGYGDWLQNLMIENYPSDIADINNLKKITIPVALIWGEKDSITPLWQGKALLRYFQNGQLRTITNAGHIPYIESPDRFNEILTYAISE